MQKIVILLIGFILSGCAFGQKISYEGRSNFNIEKPRNQITVAVHDMRPYVQSGKKSPDFTGIQKSLYGIPYNVTTKSGRPLADDFGLLIVNTLRFRNVPASQAELPFSWSFDVVKQKILNKGDGANVYYINMLEWKTETHFRSALHFNLEFHEFDDRGNELANNQEKGFFFFGENQPGKENLATATSNILEKLFSEKKPTYSSNIKNTDKDTKQEVTKPEVQKSEMIVEESQFKKLPVDIQDKIRRKCANDYPDDFEKQANCVTKQTDAWLKLNK